MTSQGANRSHRPVLGGRVGRVGGHAMLYTLATVAPTLATVLLTPFLTRILPAAEFEMVALSKAVVQVGGIVLAFGLAAAITRSYIIEESGAAGASGLVVQAALLTAGMSALGFVTGTLWTPLLLGRAWDIDVALALLGTFGASLVLIAQAFLRGAGRPIPFVLIASGGSLIGPATGLLLVTTVRASAALYLGSVAAGYLICAIAGLIVVVRAAKPELRLDHLRRALQIGVPTVPHSAALALSMSGIVVIAARVLGDGGAANVILIFGSGAAMVTGAMNNAWAPLIYRTAPERRIDMLRSTTILVATSISIIVVVVALASTAIVMLTTPETFDRSAMVPAMAVASLGALPNIAYLSSAHLVFAEGRTRFLALTTPLAMTCGLLISVLLVRGLGIVGVGVSYVAIQSLLALVTNLGLRRYTGIRWRPPVPRSALACAVVAACVGAIAPSTSAPWAAVRAVMALAATAWLARSALRQVRELAR